MLKQKPKWYFVLLTLLWMCCIASVFLIFLYLMSFVGLVFHERRIFEALAFGPQTFFQVIHGVPILLAGVIVAVFILLHLLVRHFAFAYMRPVMGTLGVGLLLTLSMFIILSRLDPERKIAHFGEGHFSGIMYFHKQFRPEVRPQVIRGTLQTIKQNEYYVQDASLHTLDIHTDAQTRFHEATYVPGDTIMVFVHPEKGVLYAVGIRKDNPITH